MKFRSNILKLALFATGLSGIVAEYILSTMATYFLGDSVFQWTMIVSVMLFSMGLGSGLSKYIENQLLLKFVLIEFLLSILVSFSSLTVYIIAAYTIYDGLLIYTLSILIGTMIGMEIPLVVRLNNSFEILRINVASVIEKDYYGSLAGGMFFAFIGLPFLGLTYTPFILGFINFSVAVVLLGILWYELKKTVRKKLILITSVVAIVLISGFFFAKPIVMFGEQKRYKDKVVYEKQSKYQKIVITQWKDEYWLYINGNQQLSTLDETMYHEPLVHPPMQLMKTPYHVLILGGGDGCAVREVLKYSDVKQITLVDLDPAMTNLGKTHPVLTELNDSAMHHPKVEVINQDGFTYLINNKKFYDVIIVDLPDPKTVELGRLYSYEFYLACRKHLRPHGVLITQSGSPYYATKAFKCIEKSMQAAGFVTAPLHNQILTLGEWGWVLGVNDTITKESLKQKLRSLEFNDIETEWLNNEAMLLMTSFGKKMYVSLRDTAVEVNKIHNPVLYRYYLKGNWEDLY